MKEVPLSRIGIPACATGPEGPSVDHNLDPNMELYGLRSGPSWYELGTWIEFEELI